MPEVKYQEHKCSNLPDTGISVFYGSGYLKQSACWFLHIAREATDRDLEENHHLEEVGEEIWSVSMEISYCPYCGANLYKGMEHPSEKGEFVLADSSSYSLKIK